MSDKPFSVYILRCSDSSYYTGIAGDVARRLREHGGPRGARYLRGRVPVKLVFEWQAGSHSEAARAEARIKQLRRAEKERLIAGELHIDELLGQLRQ